MKEQKVRAVITIEGIHSATYPLGYFNGCLKDAGFNIDKHYSMYYDPVLNAYVCQQTIKTEEEVI